MSIRDVARRVPAIVGTIQWIELQIMSASILKKYHGGVESQNHEHMVEYLLILGRPCKPEHGYSKPNTSNHGQWQPVFWFHLFAALFDLLLSNACINQDNATSDESA
jgi:hypothetical protein